VEAAGFPADSGFVVIHSPVQAENGRKTAASQKETHNILKGLTVFKKNCQGEGTAFRR